LAVNGGYAVLLVIMAVLPSTSKAVALFSLPDWFAHAMAYGIQMALVYWASLPSLGHHRSLVLGVVAAGAFGLVTEGLQYFQPGRTVELRDLEANIAGALIFCTVIVAAGRFGPWRQR
jgi:VanZ family protein